MGIIGWIIVAFIVLGIIGAILEWIFDYIKEILLLAVVIAGLIFFGVSLVLFLFFA